MDFAQEIQIFRAKHRLTQGEMAKLCGVSKMTISSIERGIQNPKVVTAYRIRFAMNDYEKGMQNNDNI